jgi:hypothetical protein
MRRRYAAFLPVLAIALACSGGGAEHHAPPPPPPPQARADAAPAAPAAPTEADLERMADGLMARAAEHEPKVSAILQGVAASLGGTMAGFEHRLKKRDSMLRKIRTILAKDPAGGLARVVIDDALRYTLQVEDTPPGNHATAIRAAFAALEQAGHKVVKVKNYWPRGDNYSGVNAVLEAPDGLPWELQFHTAESFRIKDRDHELYEEMRLDETPVERKRVLYHQLAAPWEIVPIPKDLLTPGALHKAEEIIQRPPP